MATLDDITLGDIELDPLAGLTLDDIEIQPAEGSGFWRQALDLPVSALGGTVTGLKGMTDLFGANNPVSQELASYQQFYNQSLSPEGQADQQEVARIMQEAQDKGMWEQIKAGGRAFAVAPLDTAAQSLGTMAPIVATGLAGRAVGLGAKGVQAVQAGAGAGMNTGIVKDSIYQDTKNFLLRSGKSEEEADRVALEAQSYGGQNVDQLLLAAGLGAADALFGAEKILGNAISKTGKEVTGGVIVNALKTGVSEAIPEAAQGGQEAMAPNIALQREGYSVPTMRGVFAQGTMEGLAGFAAGAPVGAAEGMAPRLDDRNLPTMQVGPQPSSFTPQPAADTVEIQETFGDPTTAAAEPAQEQAAPASYNPDDFEVVEEPSETIVTEPPAASASPESTQPATTVDTSAQEWADSLPSADKYLQKNNKTDAPYSGGFQDGELLIDKYGENPYVYKAQYIDPKTFLGNLKLEGMTYEQVVAMPTTQQYIEWYKQGNEPPPISVVVKQTEAEKGQLYSTDRRRVIAAIEAGVSKIPALVEVGRRDEVFAGMQQQPAPVPVQEKAAPKRAAARPAPVAAPSPFVLPRELSRSAPRYGMATISFSSDLDRAAYVLANDAVKPSKAAPKFRAAVEAAGLSVSEVVEHGKKVKAAIKQEAGGGAAPRSEVDIRLPEIPFAATPDAPAKRSRRRIKNMTAQSGAIDLSIVEDLVEYGKTIYRAGMSFGKWAGEMVKEFGQGIASFLKQAFDRIVQAYKDSPYSDTTGAVGNVQPKRKPRQFEQRVSQAENVSQETKDLIGNDMYEVLRLEPLSQEAAARLAEIGVDAAERSILLLADPKAVATPLDFAIAQHLQINLDATGFPARAAAITRIISQKATSFGQTISTLKMFARLSPEGIVQYANQTIEEHINSLPPERQQQIRTAQDTMAQAEKDLSATRKTTAEDAIINGTQGGEKIQDKLKRRIPDKTQKQSTNVSIRSVLTSQATKDEATKQITQILTDNGISHSEATALATAITSRFYTVLENARKAMAANLKPRSGKGRMTAEKLAAQLRDGKLSDQDFIAALSQMVGLPAMTPATRAELLKLANEYKAAKDDDIRLVTAGKIFERIHELVPPDFWTKVRTFRIIMMLFSPKTWVKNIGGNSVQWTLNAGADSIVNGFVDPTLTAGKAAYLRARGKTPEQIASATKRTSAFAKTGRLKALLTPISDLKKGYLWNQQNNPTANWWDNSKAALDHLRVLSKLTTQNKFEMADIKDVGRRVFSNPFMAFLEGTTSIALGGPDRGFWMSAYRASLAQREAAAKLNGEWAGLPSPEDIEGAQADAMAAIYQQKNSISDLGVGVRTELNKFSTRWAAKVIPGMTETTQYGLGSMLVTFAQVPGALARTAINWSPLGTVNALYSAMNGILWKSSAQRFGKPFNQAEFNKAFTQALGGTGIYIAGYWLYAMGIITASQEEDKDLEAMRKALGMGQYSINLSALKRMLLSGNIWTKQPTLKDDAIYRYDWVQPVAITFAAGAELAKMVETNDRNGIKKGLAGKAGMAAISLAAGAKSLEDLPLLSGLSSFMRTWGNEGMLAAVVKTVASEPSAFVPQLVRQANQLNNNMIRETRGGDSGVLRAFNQLAANTPGVSDSYPVRFDVTGTPVERYQRNSNTLFNVLVSPATRNYGRVDPALAEVQRLMNATGSTEQIPREVERTAEINGRTVYLTNEQMSAHQYYVGNYTMSMFNWRMNSPRYVALPDEEKVKILVQDLKDVHAATKSALFGHDVQRLTRRQRVMRSNLVNSPLGQSMPPR